MCCLMAVDGDHFHGGWHVCFPLRLELCLTGWLQQTFSSGRKITDQAVLAP